jgi:glycosyltransferase involved in cell wall biosynthesis
MSSVSIALCTYNGAQFLNDQLESFLAQTRLPDELVVTDDCSTDKTIEALEAFAISAPFKVRIFRNDTNLGSTRNFERAISLCEGDVIFLSDQDDVWMPGKIERVAAEFEKSESLGFVFTDAEIVDENLQPLHKKLCDLTFNPALRHITTRDEMLRLLLPRNYCTGATMAFRSSYRDLFFPVPANIPEMIHDAWIAFVIIAAADFKFVDDVLIKYRQHDKQQLGVIITDDSARLSDGQKYRRSLKILKTEIERIEKISDAFTQSPKLREFSAPISQLAADRILEISEKIIHFQNRNDLPAGRMKRIAPVWKEIRSGRYHKFSGGYRSALKDALTGS